MDIAAIAWLLITVGAFVAGYFVGKRHGARVERAASLIKDTTRKL